MKVFQEALADLKTSIFEMDITPIIGALGSIAMHCKKFTVLLLVWEGESSFLVASLPHCSDLVECIAGLLLSPLLLLLSLLQENRVGWADAVAVQ